VTPLTPTMITTLCAIADKELLKVYDASERTLKALESRGLVRYHALFDHRKTIGWRLTPTGRNYITQMKRDNEAPNG